MNIDEIFNMWKEDSKMDISELAADSANTPMLHGKYLQLYTNNKLRLRSLEKEFRKLKLAKYQFYTEGPTDETNKLGWKLPPRGIILRADIPMYMEADDDLVKLQLKIDYAAEKVSLLENIVKMINNRGFLIKNALDDIRWKNGI